jgi:hypothetical protein
MMLLATGVVSALFASTALAPATLPPPAAPIIVHVTAMSELSPRLIKAILAETDSIWRQVGVTFVWRRVPSRPAALTASADAGPWVPNTLRLTIGDDRGDSTRSGRLPLGWIRFDDETTPDQEIYLSHANAKTMMDEAPGVVGIVAQMPLIQRETLLARAMGRALAHELGHYLLASKVHTPRGLMKAVLTAAELFGRDVNAFWIDTGQRRTVAARLRGQPVVASR